MIDAKTSDLQNLLTRTRLALEQFARDMHHPSSRPCATCREASIVLGHYVGCYRHRLEMGMKLPDDPAEAR